MKTVRIVLITIIVVLLLHGCATTAPTVVTKTQTETVEVEKLIPVPAALSDDCPPAPLTGTTVAAALERLASVEEALAQCRAQLTAIRALPLH